MKNAIIKNLVNEKKTLYILENTEKNIDLEN